MEFCRLELVLRNIRNITHGKRRANPILDAGAAAGIGFKHTGGVELDANTTGHVSQYVMIHNLLVQK